MDESIADVDGEAWRSGVCVAEGYCRWLQSGARAPYVACRYSEGHRFEEGPLEVACEEGATPESPFCGGACGDCPTEDRTGAPSIDFEPSCVGRSEARSFGVCAPYAVRCSPGPSAVSSIFECENRLRALGPVGTGVEFHCACMVLSPALIPELADHGWPVALESCLAYRDRFPDQVLCVDEAWNEL